MFSFSVSLRQEVRKQSVTSIQAQKNVQSTQKAHCIDDDKLRDITQIMDNKFLEMEKDMEKQLKALSEKFDKLQSKFNARKVK